MPSKFGGFGPWDSLTGGFGPRNAVFDKKAAATISTPCRKFVVSDQDEVQFNVIAYMWYQGRRITKVVDTYRKPLHAKITQELHAMNMVMEGTNHYVTVSICSPKQKNG